VQVIRFQRLKGAARQFFSANSSLRMKR
jgi:hypothetical protein